MEKQNSLNIAQKRLFLRVFFIAFALPIIFIAILLSLDPVGAAPAGASIVGNRTQTATATSPDSRNDSGGTITTMTLNTIQQDSNWKAYVGNISGTLTLDDSTGATIFRWDLDTIEVTGEVYVARNDTIDWSVLACIDAGSIVSEQTFLGMPAVSADNINRTFNYTTHDPIVVAGRTIGASTCRSTATFVADAAQPIATADFQEVLLESSNSVVYMSAINRGAQSFNAATTNDFQLIVPDDVTTAATTYYFYVEIGS